MSCATRHVSDFWVWEFIVATLDLVSTQPSIILVHVTQRSTTLGLVSYVKANPAMANNGLGKQEPKWESYNLI